MSTYTVETIVRAYNVYWEVWEAAVGEVLLCQQECGNVYDPYAVAVLKRGIIVGHVPRAIKGVDMIFKVGRLYDNCTLRVKNFDPIVSRTIKFSYFSTYLKFDAHFWLSNYDYSDYN